MTQTATAHWEGNLKEGQGTLTTKSGVLNQTPYSFKTRFAAEQTGTNPEELLATAHAGCFTMAVTMMLGKKGVTATRLDTTATVTMEETTIMGVHLNITGIVLGITAEDFASITKEAEQNCVISKALSVPITSEVHFEI